MSDPEKTSIAAFPLPGTIGAALVNGEQQLREAGVLKPRRHAEILLESVLAKERIWLYLHAQDLLSALMAAQFNTLLDQRKSGEPLQYISGWTPFYNRRFIITPGVFIPRFDTEVIVETVITRYWKKKLDGADVSILDLCCGSGAIGLSVAADLPKVNVILADNSQQALNLTERNARLLGVSRRVQIIDWDVLDAPRVEWRDKFHFIVANPPYIPANEIQTLHADVQREPHSALTDGGDGLSFYRRWALTIPGILHPHGCLLMEIGDSASEDVVGIFSEIFRNINVLTDLAGNKRAVEAWGRKSDSR